MPDLKNVVAVDWRSGKDRCYFFFKDSNTYTRFDIGDNKVPEGYPAEVNASNWGKFHSHVKNLRFGFTTTNFQNDQDSGFDDDILWLFYDDNGTPMVCRFDQDIDEVRSTHPVSQTVWAPLIPHFYRIVAGTWWQRTGYSLSFRFLMNDGHSLTYDYKQKRIRHESITHNSWPGLSAYKDRIITAVQNDRTLADSYLYIFLTNNQYIRYNMQRNRAESGPINVDDESWPGLLDD
jgi:hypothetical protein